MAEESTFYQLPAVMPVPHRPEVNIVAPDLDDMESVKDYAKELHKAVEDLGRWSKEMHSSIYDTYIPQADRIENLTMVGETIAERPTALGSRRFFYHRPNRALYMDVRYGGTNEWDLVFAEDASFYTLDTTNFDNVLSASDGNVQDAMDTLDDHGHPATDITVETSGFGGVLGSTDDDVQDALGTIDNMSHTDIQDIGLNTHDDIDDHIADGAIHAPIPTIDYAYVSGIDGGTDVTASELEELTDASETTLHTHSHTNLSDIGLTSHADIDLHIGDSTIHFTEGSIDHGSISGLGDDDHTQYLRRDEWLENGFENYEDTALAWDDGTLTLTLSPAVTSFVYYYEGYEFSENGNLSATITDTEGLWVFYIGSGGAASLSTIHNPSYAQVEQAILNECIVAYVYWDATNNDGRLMDERHQVAAGEGKGIPRGTHHYLHEIFGAQYIGGLTIADITVDQAGSADSHAQFSISSGEFYDEDLEHDTLAHASTDTWECYYVDGSGNVRWVDCEATFPVYAIGGTIAYNNAGTLTAVASNKYICYHVFATNIHTDAGGDYYPVVAPGIAEYGSKADAQDAALSEIQSIDFGNWPKEEVIPIATVIYRHSASMSNGVEAATQSTLGGGNFIDWRFTSVSGSSTSVNDHGALSGLSDDDHPQYLLTSGGVVSGNLTLQGYNTVQGAIEMTTGQQILMTYGGPVVFSHDNGMKVNASDELELGTTNKGINLAGSGARPDYNGADLALFTDIATALGAYLPLTAGSGKTLSGNLYIDKTADPTLFLREGGSANDYGAIIAPDAAQIQVRHYRASGDSFIAFDPMPLSGTDDAEFRMFRSTNTTGNVRFQMFVGDGTSSVQHLIRGDDGVVTLCQQAGGLVVSNGYVQLPYLGSAPGSPVNGMIWMESDGLHIYYAGAEKLVAGV